MKRLIIIAILFFAAHYLFGGPLPFRRLFDYEQRFGDTRPKPDLTQNKASLRSGERLGEGSAKSPGWQPNGICICDTAWGAAPSLIVSDGKNGAIVCWTERLRGWPGDTSHSLEDIYAQRVDSGGNERWPHQGVPVCSLANTNASFPAIVADGHGGAIIAWEEYGRIPDGYTHAYAQRLDSLGNRLWPENGMLVCGQPSGYVDICTDGHAGAIIAWVDGRDEVNTSDNIYAQRMDSVGNMVWQADGVPVCTANNIQFLPYICESQNRGAIISWEDYRTSSYRFYAQKIDGNGNNIWTNNGVIVSDTGNDYGPNIESDQSDGAIIGWSNGDIYGQHIDSFGNRIWGDTGMAIFIGPGSQGGTNILESDGYGGGVYCWLSSADTSIHGKRITHNGVVAWGEKIIYDGGGKGWPKLISLSSDYDGNIFIIWDDERHSINYADQYAQKIDTNGNIIWADTGVAVCTLQMEYETYPQIVSDGLGGAICTWFGNPIHSANQIYVQRVYSDGKPGGVSGFPSNATVLPRQHMLCAPNPFNNYANIQYSLREKQEVTLLIYNIAGQLVKTLFKGQQEAGKYMYRWNGVNDQGKQLAKGMYFIQLRTNGQTQTIKSTIIR